MAEITADGLAPGELRQGTLEVRLARSEAEVAAAQALRYRVFYDEMSAVPSPEMARVLRDFDGFDPVADHLLVLDHARGTGAEAVVGTYRLIRRPAAARAGGFYSASEYDIGLLADYPGEVLELGRSCVHAAYRNRPTMQLLWRGIAAYVFEHGVELMFGCASLPGVDPRTLALPLSYLHWHHLAPPALRPRALPDRYVDMRILPQDRIDPRAALNELPPLIKGYLRAGAWICGEPAWDPDFNTADLPILMPMARVAGRYARHFQVSQN